ncbi:helix-turn-helix domain-containing protein [Saccharopolyspora shandongensis]|uniref:helix-turn-helix domain-containing protein n=1 Tax=Saccharopolyspora shandongensis TaxID=418495 RepID=UPI0033F3C454
MPGSRLTRRDRRVIATGLVDGLGYAEIARRLARPTSTISREVTRNGGRASYDPDTAHRATKRRVRQRKPGAESAARPHRRPETVRAVERQLAATLIGTGLPKMSARVLAALLTTDDAGMNAAELGQHLRVSSSSVSKSVGYLEGQGMIRRERITQRRVERYVVDPDAWFQAFLASAQRNHQLADTARRGSDLLGRTTPAGTRLHALSRFHQQLTNDIIERARHWRHALTEPPPGASSTRA